MTGYPLAPRRTNPVPSNEELQHEIEAIEKKADFITPGLIPEFKDRTLLFFTMRNWERKQRKENPTAFFFDYPPDDYEIYRKTPLWRKIRKRVIASQNGACLRCKADAQDVHHRSYAPEVMEGLDDTQLVALCRHCHELVEFDDSGNRRSRDEQESILAERPPRPGAGDRIAIEARGVIAERLRNVRESYGRLIGKPHLSQTDFAHVLDVPLDLLRSWERGGQMPQLTRLADLRRLTGVDLNMLILGENETVSTNGAVEVFGKNVVERRSRISSQFGALIFVEGGCQKEKPEEAKTKRSRKSDRQIEWHHALVFNTESQQYEIWNDVFFNCDTKEHDFSHAQKIANKNGRVLYKEKRVLDDWKYFRTRIPTYTAVREWESYL